MLRALGQEAVGFAVQQVELAPVRLPHKAEDLLSTNPCCEIRIEPEHYVLAKERNRYLK